MSDRSESMLFPSKKRSWTIFKACIAPTISLLSRRWKCKELGRIQIWLQIIMQKPYLVVPRDKMKSTRSTLSSLSSWRIYQTWFARVHLYAVVRIGPWRSTIWLDMFHSFVLPEKASSPLDWYCHYKARKSLMYIVEKYWATGQQCDRLSEFSLNL